jgi:nitronate monooxygenase
MKTALCHLLGIEHPIIAAPMGPDLTGPELVAAVSNAGGLGILQAQLCPPPLFRQVIRRVRELTDKPFGVNLILHFPVADHVAVCLEERVPILSLFWGDPTAYVEHAHAAGTKVFHQVGSAVEAQRAAAAGVDVIIAQGAEAGGHVAGLAGQAVGLVREVKPAGQIVQELVEESREIISQRLVGLIATGGGRG